MTRHPTFYKPIGWIVTFFLFGCDSDPHPHPTLSPAVQHQQQMLEQSRRLEELAFQIESQIDELRRSTNDTREVNRQTLETQIAELQREHAELQHTFRQWKETLKVSRDASPPPVVPIAPK